MTITKIKAEDGKFYEFEENDCLLFNGSVYMFSPRNKEKLPFMTWRRANTVTIRKREANRVITNYLRKIGEKEGLTYYHV